MGPTNKLFSQTGKGWYEKDRVRKHIIKLDVWEYVLLLDKADKLVGANRVTTKCQDWFDLQSVFTLEKLKLRAPKNLRDLDLEGRRDSCSKITNLIHKVFSKIIHDTEPQWASINARIQLAESGGVDDDAIQEVFDKAFSMGDWRTQDMKEVISVIEPLIEMGMRSTFSSYENWRQGIVDLLVEMDRHIGTGVGELPESPLPKGKLNISAQDFLLNIDQHCL